VAGSIGPAAAVRGVKFRSDLSLVRGGRAPRAARPAQAAMQPTAAAAPTHGLLWRGVAVVWDLLPDDTFSNSRSSGRGRSAMACHGSHDFDA
jgi:hypothetical protein